MLFSTKRKLIRQGIILASIIVLGLFLWGVYLFFDQLKNEEQTKMEIWVGAQTQIIKEASLDADINPVLLSIIEKNTTTPMILFSVKDGVYEGKNIKKENLSQQQLEALSKSFQEQYEPIEIYVQDELYEIVYYGNSNTIIRAKYSPVVIILVLFVFGTILYYFYSMSKSNEQSQLWAGMAKETAHQIGTPLSSLVGWTEILRMEKTNENYIREIEKDIDRLKTITDRFSKIGSVPKLRKSDVVKATADAFDYLKSRSSRLIDFSIQKPENEITVYLNEELLSWTIENLVKNSIDAVRGKGEIHLEIAENAKWAIIEISDTGRGIPKRMFKTIFKPGETSKARGWGLGLSLAKRIIEEYHEGKIRVKHSEINKGTTFEILLKKAKD